MGLEYIRSLTGIIKGTILVSNLIGLICIAATGISPRGDAFLAATASGIILTTIIVFIRIFDLTPKIKLPWNKIEFVYCLIWAVFLIITSALVIDMGIGGYIAGGVFGLFSTIGYLIDGYHLWGEGL